MSRPLPKIKASAYESASASWRLEDWTTYQYGPNAALHDLEISRARAQDAIRNNAWLSHGLRLLVSHLIGCGIQPRPKLTDDVARESILDLWDRWGHEADADGVQDFAGWQTLVARARMESGECFIRLRPRRLDDGLAVPLQVQAIEGSLCPVNLTAPNGDNQIRQGIELTPFGKRVAYWMLHQHPGELSYVGQQRTRVPAALILHHYTPQRPGQLRGAPDMLSALLRARKLDLYESAELTRKQNRAKFNGAITRLDANGGNPLTIGPVSTSEDGARSLVDIEEGYMLQLAPGETVDLYNGDSGGQGAIDFLRTHLRAIAAAMGVPYELLTGDYEGTNDRIMRVILNAFYRHLEIAQDQFIAQVLRPIWHIWLDAAVLSGALRLPNYATRRTEYQRCEWRTHGWSYVNPLQEAQTKALLVEKGFESRSAIIAERGWDAAEVDRQQAEDRAREERLGLYYRESPAQSNDESPVLSLRRTEDHPACPDASLIAADEKAIPDSPPIHLNVHIATPGPTKKTIRRTADGQYEVQEIQELP